MDLGEHVLFVHAHPDDETLATGAAVATAAETGVATVLTLTLGERGEVRPDRRADVEAHGITAMRSAELDGALAALGATRVEPSLRYEDSGMRWDGDRAVAASDASEAALTTQPLDAVVAQVVDVVARLQPSALVTYDADGGYGHPDHIRVHEAVVDVARVFDVPVYVRTPEPADVAVPLAPVRERVLAALAAYASQLAVEGDEVVHVGGQRHGVSEVEHYRLVRSRFVPGVFTTVVIGLLGLVIGTVGTVTHRAAEPWGLVLSLAAALGIMVGPRLLGARPASLAGAVGVVIPIAIAALDPFRTASSAGLVGGDLSGWLWGIVPALSVLAAIIWPPDRRSRRTAAAARLDTTGRNPS